MPTYDYECENGHRFEVFQSMKDDPLSTCVQCDGRAKRRIGAGAGFIFKGGGFYITDYRSKEYKEKSKTESSTPGAGGETSKKPAAGGEKSTSGTKSGAGERSGSGERSSSGDKSGSSDKSGSGEKGASGDKPSGNKPSGGGAA